VIAQLTAANVANEIFGGMVNEPLKFPCSEFGKGVLKAAKYLWVGMTGAATAVCCIGGFGVGCVICTAGANLAGYAGAEMANDYCG
jgi:hypothetical protein